MQKNSLSLLLLTLDVRLISKEEQNINLGDRDGLTRPLNLQIGITDKNWTQCKLKKAQFRFNHTSKK